MEPVEGSDGTDGRWRIARKVASDRVISTVDLEARHAHKTVHQRRDGFKAHVVVEPVTGLVAATRVTKASGADSADATVGIKLLATDITLPAGGSPESSPVEVLGDSAYGTGEALDALGTAGRTAIIKPWPLRPAIPGGFTIEDFRVDETAGTVTCPNGLTRKISAKRKVTFGAGCAGCALRVRCTTAARGRHLELHPHDAVQRAHRARATDPVFQVTYRTLRPMVERSIAWLTRGNRKVRYRVVVKNNAWFATRAAAVNLTRLMTLGLQRTSGT